MRSSDKVYVTTMSDVRGIFTKTIKSFFLAFFNLNNSHIVGVISKRHEKFAMEWKHFTARNYECLFCMSP